MDRNGLISIVVPVYNVEKYIRRCINSIIAQTYHNLEIILVDDGSTDESGNICDVYKDKDDRVVVVHKKNGGLSDARNAGMNIAQGEFICFVDSDDYISDRMISELYDLILKDSSDIAICGMADCYDNKKNIEINDSVIIKKWTGKEAFKEAFIGSYFGMSVCTKMFRRQLLISHSFVKGRTSEDVFFTPYVLYSAGSVSFTSEPLYFYWHRRNSITTATFNEKSMDVVEGYKQNLAFIDQNCPEYNDVGCFRLHWAYFIAFDRLLRTPDYKKFSDYRIIRDYLKQNWASILECRYFNVSRRISIVACKINVKLYEILLRLNDRKNLEIYD